MIAVAQLRLVAFALCAIAFSGAAPAVTAQSAPRHRPTAHKAAPAHAAGPQKPQIPLEASPPQPPAPPLPNALPAHPADITFAKGRLTVVADNSDLGQILHSLAGSTGMTVSGLSQSSRVFGTYGPGTPRDVLTALLSGTGYNFVMTGHTSDGAPRDLLLTPQSGGPAYTPPPAAQSQYNPEPPPWEQQHLGPGAVAHVPPDQQPQNQLDQEQRMAQHMQQLRRMRFQQDQQQQQPQ